MLNCIDLLSKRVIVHFLVSNLAMQRLHFIKQSTMLCVNNVNTAKLIWLILLWFSGTGISHLNHLDTVLTKLMEQKVTLNVKMFVFDKPQIKPLGRLTAADRRQWDSENLTVFEIIELLNQTSNIKNSLHLFDCYPDFIKS